MHTDPYFHALRSWLALNGCSSLQCLSAIAVFVTRQQAREAKAAAAAGLQCLSAIAVFVTISVMEAAQLGATNVFNAFRLLRYLLPFLYGN